MRSRVRWTAIVLLVRAFPGWCTVTALLALASGGLPAFFAVLVARLVETLPGAATAGLDSADGRSVVGVLAGMAGILVVQDAVRAVYEVVRWNLTRRYNEYLVARVLRATISAPRLELFEDPELSAKVDRTVRVVGDEPGDLVDGLTGKYLVRAEGLAAAVVVAAVSPVVAVVLAGVWLAVGRWLQADMLRADYFAWQNSLRRAEYYSRVGTRPEWAKELRVFGLADWLADRFGRQWARVMEEMWKARQVGQGRIWLLLGLVVVAHLVVMAWATLSVVDGTLGLGQLTLLAQGLVGMALLADLTGDDLVEYGSRTVGTVLDLEQTVAAQTSLPAGRRSAIGVPVRDIHFDDVTFSYPGHDAAVFDGLSLRVEAGRSLGIVGLNGAGKTTLIKLLAGLGAPQRGRITVDGIDLADLDLASWRGGVAAIFQDFVRYELPARDNIGFGAIERLHAADVEEYVTDAAQRAGAGSIVASLPSGLATPLSRRFPGGVDLSGGQWQRIALARAVNAVNAGARVLALDEPTAQLDVRAEADVYDRFFDLTRGLTTIVISHRFSTVRRADRIVVLDDGRITEDGSHDQLVAADGTYARLFARQASRYHDTTGTADTEAGGQDG